MYTSNWYTMWGTLQLMHLKEHVLINLHKVVRKYHQINEKVARIKAVYSERHHAV